MHLRTHPLFTRLEARKVGYRFDLERDVPWHRLDEPGVFYTDALLERVGLDPAAVAAHPARAETLQWSLALATAEAFVALERDVIAFVGDQADGDRTRSADLLLEEEVKHVEMFERLSAALRAMRPDLARVFDDHYRPPPSFDALRAQIAGTETPTALAYLFWLNTVFFEEYTVWIHHILDGDVSVREPTEVQPAWLAAHLCHRREETQHVLTDAAYLQTLDLDAAERSRLSKAFVFFLERQLERYLCLDTALAVASERHPDAPALTLQRRPPLFEDLVHHRAFRHTRESAPVLARLRAHAGDTRPRSVVEGPPAIAARGPHDTLPRRLEQAASEHPDRGVTFVRPDGSEQTLTYPDLLATARRYHAGLHAAGFHAGDVVMVQVLKPGELVPFFWGCLLAGVVPAPLAPPVSPRHANEQLARLLRIHELLDRPLVVTDPVLRPAMEGFLAAQRVDGVRFVEVGELLGPAGAAPPPHPGWSDDLAFLQFSSGSMGHPRGVMLTHRNLIADAEAMLAFRGRGGDEVFCSWLPLYHDMGLIGYHVTPIVAGARQVLMTPLQFMKDPLSWLRVMSRHGATITGGPNFALARVLRRLRTGDLEGLDLSPLHCFLVGAEPISRRVLETFCEALAPAGLAATAMCPGYGLAEATLAVTMTAAEDRPAAVTVARASLHDADGVQEVDPDTPGALTVVDCGAPIPGVRLRIVDGEGEICPEGCVGAIEVAGPTVMQGFFRDAANTERALDDAEWLDTGDLGLLRGGRLYVTGRAKDVFFVGGRNFYTHDVEAIASEVPGVRAGYAALVVDWDDQTGVDQLTLFVGLDDDAPDDTLRRVHQHVLTRVGVAVERVVHLERSGFARTTSGKLARHQLRSRDRAGAHAELPTFVHPASRIEVVRTIWAEVLGCEAASVHIDDELAKLGGTSIQAAEIHDRIERAWHAFFDQELLVEGTTVRRMAAWLARHGRPLEPARTTAPAAVRGPTPGALPEPAEDDIAVVAIGCRYPGASTPEELWTLLRDGRAPFREAPPDRFDVGRLHDPRPHTPGRVVSASGTFLDSPQLTDFDPTPFGLSDAVARALDPQQRLFLQVCRDALSVSRTATDRVGVFAAAGDNEYALRYLADPSLIGPHGLLGALKNMVSARVAQVFRLTGPALTVDTACSSSLMAVHLACRALRSGECDAALAGGAQVNLTESVWLYFSQTGLLSSTGECRPFDRDAAGLVPGEGAGVVLLKTLARARQDGDRILGVIRGTAVNNDGGSLSGTAPNPEGQRRAIRDAWEAASVPLSTAGYIEAHAAGTAIGDAVEVHSLAEVFAGHVHALPMGSVKSNLGHTLAASGITSLLKVLLSMRYGRIPATVGCPNPAERIRFEDTVMEPVLTSRPWPTGPRVAGIDSFGLGGTNVHVVVSDAEASGSRQSAESDRRVAYLLPGPGSQVVGMGRALYDAEPAYRAAVDMHGLAEALWGTQDIHAIEAAQPAVFAHGVALAAWLAELGVTPDAVVGHSAGELVAACLAGVITVADGLHLARVRGDAMAAARPGRMAAVFASRGEVEAVLERVPGLIDVAASNAPDQTVVSGEAAAVRTALGAFVRAGLAAKLLSVGCGAHSELMAEAAPAVAAALERVRFARPRVPWFSSVSAEPLADVDEAYWLRQLRAPVDFVGALEAASRAGFDTFVELGGTAGLSGCAEAILGERAKVIPLGDKDDVSLTPAWRALDQLAALGLAAPRPPRDASPRRLWIDAPARPRPEVQDGIPLRLEAEPAIRDHVTGGVATAPAALLVDLALWDVRRRGDVAAALADVVVGRPLALTPGQARVARVEAEAGSAIRLVSVGAGGGEAVEHLSATVIPDHGRTIARLDLGAIRARCGVPVPMDAVYAGLAERGFALGPSMRAVVSAWSGPRELLAELVTPAEATRGRWLDASLLDGATQATAGLIGRLAPAAQGMFLGFGLGEVSVWEPVHGGCLAYVKLRTRVHAQMTSLRFDVTLCDEDGHVLAEVRDFAAKVKEPAVPSPAQEPVAHSAPQPLTEPSEAPSSELESTLRRLIGASLRRSPQSLPADQPLARLGMDSMKAVALIRALEVELGVRLPVTLLFEAQTLRALHDAIATRS